MDSHRPEELSEWAPSACVLCLQEHKARASGVLAGGMVTMACPRGKSPCGDTCDGPTGVN